MTSIPHHITIIMDGNGRWAQKRHMPRTVGHSKGAAGVRELVQFCAHKGVKYLTQFVASAPKTEVALLWQVAYTELSSFRQLTLHKPATS